MQEEKKEKGLGNPTIIFMVAVAVFFDITPWLLVFVFMDWLVSIFAYLTFFLWFKIQGVSFMKPKRILAFGTSFLLEIIPFVAALPALTGAVIITAIDSKIKKVVPGLDIIKK